MDVKLIIWRDNYVSFGPEGTKTPWFQSGAASEADVC